MLLQLSRLDITLQFMILETCHYNLFKSLKYVIVYPFYALKKIGPNCPYFLSSASLLPLSSQIRCASLPPVARLTGQALPSTAAVRDRRRWRPSTRFARAASLGGM
jgi:hypothetical protein